MQSSVLFFLKGQVGLCGWTVVKCCMAYTYIVFSYHRGTQRALQSHSPMHTHIHTLMAANL